MGTRVIYAREEGGSVWTDMGCEITQVNAARAFSHSVEWKPGEVKIIETKFCGGRATFKHRVEQRHDFLVYPLRDGA